MTFSAFQVFAAAMVAALVTAVVMAHSAPPSAPAEASASPIEVSCGFMNGMDVCSFDQPRDMHCASEDPSAAPRCYFTPTSRD
jgi:hypothetical protein